MLELLANEPGLLLALTGLFSLFVGSFLNVVILRLPPLLEHDWRGQCREFFEIEGSDEPPPGLVLARSKCPSCGYQIKAWQNLPLLSYILLRGRCANCGTTISLQYPFVEALTAAASVVVVWQFGFTIQAAAGLVLTWALIALSGIDIHKQLLPDSITLPLLWLGLILSVFYVFVPPEEAITGAVAGYLALWVVFQAFRLATGKEGMGHRDFKLLSVFGAWFGWQVLPLIIILSSVVGAVIGVLMIAARRHEGGTPIPFGPYLAAAGWIAMLWGEQITNTYLALSGMAPPP